MANETAENGSSCENKDQETEKKTLMMSPDDWEPQKKVIQHSMPPESTPNSPAKKVILDKKKSLTYEEILQQLEEKIKVGGFYDISACPIRFFSVEHV